MLRSMYSSCRTINSSNDHLSRMGETRNAYEIVVGKSEWRRLLLRYKCGWEGNSIILMLRLSGCEDVDLIDRAQ
jgi:hypothetical protein